MRHWYAFCGTVSHGDAGCRTPAAKTTAYLCITQVNDKISCQFLDLSAAAFNYD